MKAEELNIGDTVKITSNDGWNTCIVKNKTKDTVILWRPYGHTSDFIYTGGVICYVGIEEIKIPFGFNLSNYVVVIKERRNED